MGTVYRGSGDDFRWSHSHLSAGNCEDDLHVHREAGNRVEVAGQGYRDLGGDELSRGRIVHRSGIKDVPGRSVATVPERFNAPISESSIHCR